MFQLCHKLTGFAPSLIIHASLDSLFILSTYYKGGRVRRIVFALALFQPDINSETTFELNFANDTFNLKLQTSLLL